MAKVKDVNEFTKVVIDSITLYIENNLKIQDKWKLLNQSIYDILIAEKKLRRYFVTKKIINGVAESIADELADVFNQSEEVFSSFTTESVSETVENLDSNIINVFNLIKDNVELYNEFLTINFSKLPKTKIDFKYCLEWYSDLYGESISNLSSKTNSQQQNNNQGITFTNDFWQLFKYLFSCLEQLTIEFNSYKNNIKFNELKKNYPILKNEILLDFSLNFCDRNTTIFQYQTLEPNKSNLLEVAAFDNIFKKYANLFPSIKLISEIRNLLEHRSNSFNLDFSIISFDFISYITNNLVFMILISALSSSNTLDIEKFSN
ncbi:hypothetical protein [Spiroplasma endosymbiont of Aspidapion aeneum]|uniref:hypothetical protein n=1 Tax=Spiroplasma endosymbiont of Aspidapion aeneum TaxID=3066276 RepID=UPI00313E3B09